MGRIKYQEALGLEVKRGRPRLTLAAKEKKKLTRLYIVQELSTREVAKAMKISEASVRRRMKAAGIPARTNAPRSRLRLFDQARLFGYIGAVGVNKTAKRWRISRRTLQRYLAKLRVKDERE